MYGSCARWPLFLMKGKGPGAGAIAQEQPREPSLIYTIKVQDIVFPAFIFVHARAHIWALQAQALRQTISHLHTPFQ